MNILLLASNPLEGDAYKHIFCNILRETHPYINYIGQAFTQNQVFQLAERASPDLLFMEVVSDEEIQYLKFIQQFKAQFPVASCIALMLYNNDYFLRFAYRCGIKDCYLKPLCISEISQIITQTQEQMNSLRQHKPSVTQKHQAFIGQILAGTAEDAQRILDHFWQSALSQEKNLADLRLTCVEFAASMISCNEETKSQFSTLILAYNQLVKNLTSRSTKEDMYDHLSLFVSTCWEVAHRSSFDATREHIQKAKEIIQQHVYKEKPISLEIVANEIYMSPFYLSRSFKKTQGVNFVDYLQDCRLDYAKLLLKTTGETVSTISMRCGYNESNSFRRLFKKKVGLSPMEYRNNPDASS